MPHDFLVQAKELESNNDIDGALDVIYEAIDRLLRGAKYSALNRFLDLLEISTCSADILLAVLTASYPAKSRLGARARIFSEIEAELKLRGEFEDGLLSGLE